MPKRLLGRCAAPAATDARPIHTVLWPVDTDLEHVPCRLSRRCLAEAFSVGGYCRTSLSILVASHSDLARRKHRQGQPDERYKRLLAWSSRKSCSYLATASSANLDANRGCRCATRPSRQ